MKLLLDTQVFLWFITDNPRLSTPANSAIEDPANTIYVSLASAWEMAIKASLGKLIFAEPLSVLLPRELSSNGFHQLPIKLPHIVATATMPFHHRDPCDRLLIAQATIEQMTVASSDPAFDLYGINRLW
jgi:PIN domain nuclease of toxin-antitoxin system